MTSIFVSYSRKDIEFANSIAAELRNRGAEVFLDYQKLAAGSFVAQLGHEIEKRDVFILIVSPRSVSSRWVQAEVTWAFMKEKLVIPLILEPANLTEMFIVASMENVDFTDWSLERPSNNSIHKLARLLKLPADATSNEVKPENLPQPNILENEITPEEIKNVFAFATDDVTDLFLSALEIADKDPEGAIFLYKRVLELEPKHNKGETEGFVAREERRLLPLRLDILSKRAEEHIKDSEWNQVKQIVDDMNQLQPNKNTAANRLLLRYNTNIRCDSFYDTARIAAKKKSGLL